MLEKMEIGLTPFPLFLFVCFCKERTLPTHPPALIPFPLLNEQLTLSLKKLEKHLDVKRKNNEEMEGVHDNASAFIHLNIKMHK